MKKRFRCQVTSYQFEKEARCSDDKHTTGWSFFADVEPPCHHTATAEGRTKACQDGQLWASAVAVDTSGPQSFVLHN